MGMMSKLKGAKKAADEHKAAQPDAIVDAAPKPRYMHKPTHAARDMLAIGSKQDDSELIRAHNAIRMSRTNSEFSFISKIQNNPHPKPKLSRTSSGLSMGDWSAYSSPSASPSLGSSRQPSFQNLPQILKNDPPVPTIPSQYVAQASSSRPALAPLDRNSNLNYYHPQPGVKSIDTLSRPMPRSYASQSASPLGKSLLVSEEPTRANSDESSNASDTSSDILEVRTGSRQPYQDLATLAQLNNHTNRGTTIKDQTPRKYFGHGNGVESAQTSTSPVPAPTSAPAAKKGRFSFMRKNQAPAVAAY